MAISKLISGSIDDLIKATGKNLDEVTDILRKGGATFKEGNKAFVWEGARKFKEAFGKEAYHNFNNLSNGIQDVGQQATKKIDDIISPAEIKSTRNTPTDEELIEKLTAQIDTENIAKERSAPQKTFNVTHHMPNNLPNNDLPPMSKTKHINTSNINRSEDIWNNASKSNTTSGIGDKVDGFLKKAVPIGVGGGLLFTLFDRGGQMSNSELYGQTNNGNPYGY